MRTVELALIVSLMSGLFLPLLIVGSWIADRLEAWQRSMLDA